MPRPPVAQGHTSTSSISLISDLVHPGWRKNNNNKQYLSDVIERNVWARRPIELWEGTSFEQHGPSAQLV